MLKFLIKIGVLFGIATAIGLAFTLFSQPSKLGGNSNSSTANSISRPIQISLLSIKNIPGLESFVISQDGHRVVEHYGVGVGPETFHDIRSVTKTIVALLVGIAIDHGRIKSVDQRLSDFFSINLAKVDADTETETETDSNQLKSIQLKHLLSMTGGFEWHEWGNVREYSNWWQAPNQLRHILMRRVVNPPGKIFNYNSAASHLLAIILTQATGMSVEDFGKAYLFQPLNIPFQKWQKDHQGFNNGSSGLTLSATGMQAIGNLILNKGIFKGTRVVSPRWIQQLVTPQTLTKLPHFYANNYGYQTWIGNNDLDSMQYIFSMGYGGQLLMIVPSKKLVISATCRWARIRISDADEHWDELMRNVLQIIHYWAYGHNYALKFMQIKWA